MNTDCATVDIISILQYMAWEAFPKNTKRLIYVLNLFSAIPGLMYFINSVYSTNDTNRSGNKWLTTVFFVVFLIIIPIANFMHQTVVQRFTTAFKLSQTGLFCAVVNSIFYGLSLVKPVRTKMKEKIPNEVIGISILIIVLLAITLIYSYFLAETHFHKRVNHEMNLKFSKCFKSLQRKSKTHVSVP